MNFLVVRIVASKAFLAAEVSGGKAQFKTLWASQKILSYRVTSWRCTSRSSSSYRSTAYRSLSCHGRLVAKDPIWYMIRMSARGMIFLGDVVPLQHVDVTGYRYCFQVSPVTATTNQLYYHDESPSDNQMFTEVVCRTGSCWCWRGKHGVTVVLPGTL